MAPMLPRPGAAPRRVAALARAIAPASGPGPSRCPPVGLPRPGVAPARPGRAPPIRSSARHVPGFRCGSEMGPIRVRTRRRTGWPTASHMRRIWRLRPSWMTMRMTPGRPLPPWPEPSSRRRGRPPGAGAAGRPAEGTPSTSTRYSFSTPKEGWVRRWASSPSLVRTSSPSLSASSLPTGNTRGSSGTSSSTVGRSEGVVGGGDDAGRLVQQVVDEPREHRQGDAVERHHVVPDVDAPAELGRLAVHRHPPVGDQLLTGPAASEPDAGQHLLESLTLGAASGGRDGCCGWRAAPQASAPGRRRSSSCSTTSGPGKSSSTGGSSSRL